MQFYTQKPPMIEAFQFTNKLIDSIIFDKVEAPCGVVMGCASYHEGNRIVYSSYWYVETPEGRMRVFPGDYVIKGAQGELYPCKAFIFFLTYAPVAAPNSSISGQPGEQDQAASGPNKPIDGERGA